MTTRPAPPMKKADKDRELRRASPGQGRAGRHAWRAGVELAKLVYAATSRFPPEERLALGAKARRAATAVPASLAYALAQGDGERYQQHVDAARGWLGQLETFLAIAHAVGFIDQQSNRLIDGERARVGRLLTDLIEPPPADQ
jgi:four helix bundle protein